MQMKSYTQPCLIVHSTSPGLRETETTSVLNAGLLRTLLTERLIVDWRNSRSMRNRKPADRQPTKMTHLAVGIRWMLATVSLLAVMLGLGRAAHAAPFSQESEEASLRIVNESEQTICLVHISPVTSDQWGGDWLGEEETISLGESRVFVMTKGDYDILLADCDGNELLHQRGVTITNRHELRYAPESEAITSCRTLLASGSTLYGQARYQEAGQAFEEALACYQKVGDRWGEAASSGNLGITYYSVGQYTAAIDYYEQALAIVRDIGDRWGEERWLGYLGIVYRYLGQYTTAIEYCEQALAVAREIGDREGEGYHLGNLGNVYDRLGQYQRAIGYHEQALAISRDIGDHRREANHLGNLGAVYNSLGQYAMAIHYREQALAIAREVGDREGEANALGGLGISYECLGQYQKAIEYYQQARAIAHDIGDQQAEGTHLNNLGNAYLAQGQMEKGTDCYEQALAIAREIGDRRGEGSRLGNLGNTYRLLGQYEKAIEHYEQALAIARQIGDRPAEGGHLVKLGGAYQNLGQYERALGYHEEALVIALDIGHRESEAKCLYNLGLSYEAVGEATAAIAYYEQAIKVIESMRWELRLEEFKSSFAAANPGPYLAIVEALLDQRRLEEAFEYAQKAKARAFLDQMGNARPDPRGMNDAALIQEEQSLRREIQMLDAQMRAERDKSEKVRNEESLKSLEARLQEKRDTYEDLLISLKLENPEYASLITVETATLAETQRLLTDTTLIEYYVSPNWTVAFVVGQEEFHVKVVYLPARWFYVVASQFATETQTTLQGVPVSLQKLYQALVVPIEPYLSTDRLLIAPHDVLHYVPFAALHDGERYLIEAHTLAQVPSASVLPFILEKASRAESGGPPLILGNPSGDLPSSGREAQSVAELYGTNAYVRGEAVEQLIWDQGPSASVLHLAAHGVYNEQAPIFSRVLLTSTANSEHDGILEVHEVYNLSLSKANLVVLSGCQTNMGEHSTGDEIVGLTRAFIYAGAPSVISSLWRVQDAPSRDLMVALHGYLKQNLSAGEALRRAQMDLLHNPETAHPFYWAGFVLSGGTVPATSTQRPGSSPFCPQQLSVAGTCRGCCLLTAAVMLLSLVGVTWSWHRRWKGYYEDG